MYGSALDEHPFSRNAHFQKGHGLDEESFQNSRTHTHEFKNSTGSKRQPEK